MRLAFNPLRFAMMFSPILLFVILSLYLYRDDWLAQPWLLAAVAGLPDRAWIFARLVRGRWRLQITRKGRVHYTLMGDELFKRRRMSQVNLDQCGQ
jgi:hypothetical protein